MRFTQLRAVTRSTTLSFAISSTLTLIEVATALVGSALSDHPDERHITLLAVSVSNLRDESALQLELPLSVGNRCDTPAGAGPVRYRPGSSAGSARWAVDRAVDTVRDRYGRAAVGYATVVLSDADRVPEEFRELAERDRRGDQP